MKQEEQAEQATPFEDPGPASGVRVRKHKQSTCRKSASFSREEIDVVLAILAQCPATPAMHRYVCEEGFASAWQKFGNMSKSLERAGGA